MYIEPTKRLDMQHLLLEAYERKTKQRSLRPGGRVCFKSDDCVKGWQHTVISTSVSAKLWSRLSRGYKMQTCARRGKMKVIEFMAHGPE